jgi:hypothetical protein
MEAAAAEARNAEEEEDAVTVLRAGKYKTYLQRYLVQLFVKERIRDIDSDLADKLDGRGPAEAVQVFHISASNYLQWVAAPKIPFREQPPLSPSLTGVPSIRQFMFGIIAPKKMGEVSHHINTWMPNFIDKVKRVIDHSDRNEDFGTLANEFDQVMDELVGNHLNQAKQLFQKVFKETFFQIRRDTTVYQQQYDRKITQQLLAYKGQTWSKILKCKGTVPPKASKAKGLEDGCSLPKDFSDILASAFQKWQIMRQALRSLTRYA